MLFSFNNHLKIPKFSFRNGNKFNMCRVKNIRKIHTENIGGDITTMKSSGDLKSMKSQYSNSCNSKGLFKKNCQKYFFKMSSIFKILGREENIRTSAIRTKLSVPLHYHRFKILRYNALNWR